MNALIVSLLLSQVTPLPPTPASQGANPGAPVRAAVPQVVPTGGPNSTQQRLSFAQQAFGLAHSMYRQGNISADAAATWSLRIYESHKDTVPSAGKEHLDRMIALEKLAKERVQQGSAPVLDVMTVSYFRAQAEQLTGKK